jgi:hypothetical protein
VREAVAASSTSLHDASAAGPASKDSLSTTPDTAMSLQAASSRTRAGSLSSGSHAGGGLMTGPPLEGCRHLHGIVSMASVPGYTLSADAGGVVRLWA